MKIESEKIAVALGLDKDKAGEAEILAAIEKLQPKTPAIKTEAELKKIGDASLKANVNLKTVFVTEDGQCFKVKNLAIDYAKSAKISVKVLEVNRA